MNVGVFTQVGFALLTVLGMQPDNTARRDTGTFPRLTACKTVKRGQAQLCWAVHSQDKEQNPLNQ